MDEIDIKQFLFEIHIWRIFFLNFKEHFLDHDTSFIMMWSVWHVTMSQLQHDSRQLPSGQISLQPTNQDLGFVMSKLGHNNMSHCSSDAVACHIRIKKKNKAETWYLVLKLCLRIKSIVLLDNFSDEIWTYESSAKFYKKCKNKIRLHN